MMPYYHHSNQFEYPLVMTKEILLSIFDEELKATKENPKLDLGCNVPIYNWYLNKRYFIEPTDVIFTTEFVLFNYANAYKYLDDEILTDIITHIANSLRKQSLGSVMNTESYEYLINQAVTNKDTRTVVPNQTIRFLKNPYYNKVDNEYMKAINQTINNEIVEKNYELIYIALCDYDLNQKRLTKSILKDITNLSLASVKNYLNKYKELNEMFEVVKSNSGTKKQEKTKKYNLAKISKMAN